MQTPVRSGAATLPVFSNAEMADYLVEGHWRHWDEDPRRFNLSDSGLGAKGGTLQYHLRGLAPAAEAMVEAALALYGEALGIEFERMERASTKVDIQFSATGPGATTSSYIFDDGAIGLATVNVATSWLDRHGDEIGDYSFLTYIHEIGHALGLGHAGAYDGDVTWVTDTANPAYGVNSNVSLNESWQMTIMSYLDQEMNPTIDADRAVPVTPMIADWIALEAIYGPSRAHAGDTIWGFRTNVSEGPLARLAELAPHNAFTLLDTGGKDLLDLTGFSADQRIDLRAETWSDVGGLRGNMGIARGTVIERLHSGSGDDHITGNGAANSLSGRAGDDWISGRNGDDTLSGGYGHDTLLGGYGADRLLGGPGDDLLDGGPGADVLTGGAGADVFRFTAAERGGVTDRITGDANAPAFDTPGWRAGDVIDLSGIDADLTRPGDQAFAFSQGGGAGPGRVWIEAANGATVVRAQVAGDPDLGLRIVIEDGTVASGAYSRSDFLL